MKAFYENRNLLNCPFSCFSAKNFTFFGHWHNEVELIFVKEGEIKIGINNDCRVISKGSLAICSARDIHYYNSNGCENEILILIFNPSIINFPGGWPNDCYLKYKFITPELLNTLNLPYSTLDKIDELMTNINIELDTLNSFYDYFVKSDIFKLTGLLLRNFPIELFNNSNFNSSYYHINIMHKVLTYIENNYMNPITLEDCAKISNLSLYHFSRLFNNIVGQSFTAYLNTLRVNKAKELFSNPDLNISYIALECGFKSIRSFNRVFKSLTGTTPSNYRIK